MTSTVKQLQKSLQEVEDKIKQIKIIMGENDLLESTLEPLYQEKANLHNQLHAQGGHIEGDHNTQLSKRAAQIGGPVSGNIITGDNVTVNNIIHNYQQGQSGPIDEDALRQQIGDYLNWMRDRFSQIELRGIKRQGQQVVQLDLETVYVPLTANTFKQNTLFQRQHIHDELALSEQQTSSDIELDAVLKQGQRLILTGGPGSGKTTVLLHIAYTLTEAIIQESPDLAAQKLGWEGNQLPLPIFVPLSAYANHLRLLPPTASAQDKTLAAFIGSYLIERQASFELPTDFLNQLLRSGQSIILLLDGLDEVPNEQERIRVRSAIEELVNGREQLQLLVTCRSAAYEGRTALSKGFEQLQVKSLDTSHVNSLIDHAYQAIYPSDQSLRERKAGELQSGIARLEANRQERLGEEAPPLVDSPLMVRLLLIVHFSEKRLPDQRAELYMKAVDAMLLPDYGPDEQVADQIGGLIGGNREAHRELVQFLAFQMHQRGDVKGREITEHDLKALLDKEPPYQPLIKDFIEITRLRGTLMEEQFETYRFIHLAFQEYLVARYLAEVIRSEGGVNSIANFFEEGPILQSWWREVVLLTVGYLTIHSPRAAESLILRLAWLDEGASDRDRALATQLQSLELAALALLEWPSASDHIKNQLRQKLASWFKNEAQLDQTPAKIRVQAGRALGRIGDPRPEVLNCDQMLFCNIPAGPFWMGATGDDPEAPKSEQPLHEVDIPYDFWLAKYPVTNAQYLQFVVQDGYRNPDYWQIAIEKGYWEEGEFMGRKRRMDYGDKFNEQNHPVVGVSWYEAIAFCHWLTARWHYKGWLPDGYSVQLPSEAEWEKTGRGGLTIPQKNIISPIDQVPTIQPPSANSSISNPYPHRKYPWGDEWVVNFANAAPISNSTNAVGCFPEYSGLYGLTERAGNVFEWTRSKWQEYPYTSAGGRERLQSGTARRVVRGGVWPGNSTYSRCAYRHWNSPFSVYHNIGFRLSVSPLL